MRLTDKETKRLISFWQEVAKDRIDMMHEHGWIQEAYPTNSPYEDATAENSDYIRFSAARIAEGEPLDKFFYIEDAVEALCKNLISYTAPFSRLLIRQWPKITLVDNLTRDKPYLTITCRLLGDDGTRKLKEQTEVSAKQLLVGQ